MSVSRGGDELSYADHDVQHIRHGLSFIGGQGPGIGVDDERQFEVTDRGLDPDELAELRAMRVTVGLEFVASEPTDSAGSCRLSIDGGFNLSGTEFLHGEVDSEQLDPTGDGTNDAVAVFRSTDEVGQMYTYSNTLVPPFDDDTNGNGGGGSGVSVTEVIDFEQLTGGGPVVDSADDWTSRIELDGENLIADIGVNVLYSLYYNVEEMEGGRTRFGR